MNTIVGKVQQSFNRSTIEEYIKFAIVGVLNCIADLGTFVVLNNFVGLGYIFCQVIAYTCGVTNSFILNRKWTFKRNNKETKLLKEIAQFVVLNLTSLAITLLLMYALIEHLYVLEFWAKIIASIAAQLINFSGYKFWIFKD